MSGSNHGQVPVVPSNFHSTAEEISDLGSDELAAFKAVAAATYQESTGYFDVVNCYDNQVLSQPLCHYVFGLGTNAEKVGEWPGFLSYLHDQDEDLYMRYYGSRGVWPSRLYGKPKDGSNVSEYTWRNSGKHIGAAYLLHRKTPGSDQIDGDLAIRGRTGKNDTTVSKKDRRAYAQWFRTWHWMYRVVASIRGDETMRRRIYEFAVRRAADLDDVEGLPESEFGVAMALRLHIYRPGTGLDMLRAAAGESNETDRIEAMLDVPPYATATGSVEFTVNNDSVTVPAGTTVRTAPDSDGNQFDFETTAQAAPAAGSTTVTANIEAVNPGDEYNVGAGQISQLPTSPAGVQSVTNPNATTGGAGTTLRDEAEQAVEWPGGAVPGIGTSELSDLGSQQSHGFDVDGDGSTDVTLTSRLSTATGFPTGSDLETIAAALPQRENTFSSEPADRPWEWVED